MENPNNIFTKFFDYVLENNTYVLSQDSNSNNITSQIDNILIIISNGGSSGGNCFGDSTSSYHHSSDGVIHVLKNL
jgi:hypothetical protein